jgi:glycosyltransferase involved in cell wall biosynthesis
VLLVCSGLDHARRGFESFARDCFDALRGDPGLDLRLVKATGPPGERERAVPTLTRDAPLARALGRATGREPFRFEQAAFALSLQPELRRTRPDVVYFSEWYTGVALNRLRRINRQDYALVMSNGSMAATGFEPFDRVHQHTTPAYEHVLAHGADPTRQLMLPVGFELPATVVDAEERRALRDRLDLPRDRPVLISTAALNRWHKRLDYVIEEVASLPEARRPYLLLVGQPEPETEDLRRLARERLGEEGHSFRTVPRPEVDALLRASDLFVLASLAEGLPRGLVEAAAHGLPCLAHDYPIARFALGPHGRLADMTQSGALAALVDTSLDAVEDGAAARAQRQYVYDNFSWDRLTPRYVDMLVGAKGRRPFTSDPGGAG